jgi:protein phosphatase
MDKIAIISDIHGNIPALEAVLENIQKCRVTKIFCLGDMVGKGPHSEKAVDLVREACDVVVRGNWDENITKETNYPTMLWHQNRLGEERLQYLSQLPFSTEFYLSGKLVRLFHASPFSVHTRIQPGDPFEKRVSMFENTDCTLNDENRKQPDVVGYGDIHNAYVQNFLGKTLFNVGSVGNPLEITQSAYAILEGDYESLESDSFSVQIIRVPYNIDLAIEQARHENMPDLDPYIQELTTARYRGLKEAAPAKF